MDKLRVTLVKSVSGSTESQKASVRSLGLTRLSTSRVFDARPHILGNIKKVNHLLRVEKVEENKEGKDL